MMSIKQFSHMSKTAKNIKNSLSSEPGKWKFQILAKEKTGEHILVTRHDDHDDVFFVISKHPELYEFDNENMFLCISSDDVDVENEKIVTADAEVEIFSAEQKSFLASNIRNNADIPIHDITKRLNDLKGIIEFPFVNEIQESVYGFFNKHKPTKFIT